MRYALALTAAAATIPTAVHAGLPADAIEVLFTVPSGVPDNGLIPPPSPGFVAGFAGQPRIANDGTWSALYRFPVADPNNPFEYVRDTAMLRDGAVWIREGLALAGTPSFAPAADFPQSQQPFSDVSVAADGTVAQILRGTDRFGLAPDGTADVTDFDFEDNKFDILVADRAAVLTEGTPLDIVPGLAAPDNRIDRFSVVKAISADRLLVSATLAADVPFSDETAVLFEIDGVGSPNPTSTLRLTTDGTVPVPGLGFTVSSFNANEEDVAVNSHGSFAIGVDIRGEPFDTDGAILGFDAPSGTYYVLAREGAGDSGPDGFPYDDLFNNPIAMNDSNVIAFLASTTADPAIDGVLVALSGAVVREGQTVGTAVPGPLQLGFANANIEIDQEANVIWYGAWNAPKADVCPNNPDITSPFVIYEGIFINNTPILEGGVTAVRDVTIDGTLFPELVVKDLPNTAFGGFHVSPDGRWLIVQAELAEPDPDICAFSINNDATPVASVLLRVDLDRVRNPSCNAADFARPFSVLDLADISAFVSAFTAQRSLADLNGDGLYDLADITLFVTAFVSGCP